MSDTDDFVPFSETEDGRDVLGDSNSNEMVFSGLNESYEGEPLVHLSDDKDSYLGHQPHNSVRLSPHDLCRP